MDRAALKELLGLVQSAKGPDRELDYEIGLASGYTVDAGSTDDGTRLVTYEHPFYKRTWHGSIGACTPGFTSSLDACVALIEKVLPGHWWVVGKDNEAWVWGPDEGLSTTEAMATPPLALLAALLQALILIEERKATPTPSPAEHPEGGSSDA